MQINTLSNAPVWLMPTTLSILLNNLVANSIKFTAVGDTITVTVTAEADQVVLEVADDGPGIAVEWQARVFQIFERVPDHDAERVPGSGIGLFTVHELVKSEGGQLSLHSVPGAGCTFRISFPIWAGVIDTEVVEAETIAPEAIDIEAKAEAVGVLAQAATANNLALLPTPTFIETDAVEAPAPTARKTLLIIEDHPLVRAELVRELEVNYRCVTASSGEQGLALAADELPDVIICDIGLPGMDGYAVCEQLKADGTTCHIPLFFLTAYDSDEHRLQGLLAQGDDYLCKPHSPIELRLKITNRLQAIAHLQQWWQEEARRSRWDEAVVKIAGTQPRLAQNARAFRSRLDAVLAKGFPDPDYSASHMATDLHMSIRKLQREFVDYGLTTPVEYLRNYRLGHARELLRQQMLVKDVSEACGLNSKLFSQYFKDRYGKSPSEFRAEQVAELLN